MAEAVANVARRVNATVEEGKDYLGKNPLFFLLYVRLKLFFAVTSYDQAWPYLVWPEDGDKEPSFISW